MIGSIERFARDLSAAPDTSFDIPLNELVAEIRARQAEFDRLSHVPRDVVDLMKRAGVFRAATPSAFGGDERPPHEFLRMIEAIAMADGSAAWVAAFGSANTYLAALPVETQRRIYANGPDQVYAGGLYPLQKAQVVDGGVRLSGRWRFASGCLGADWIGVGFTTEEPLFPATPHLTTYMAVCPADEVEIIENWDVVGMQGTGSHDTQVKDKFYPLKWICARGAIGTIDTPLFRYPALSYQAQVHAAVNIGLGRAAIDTAVQMAGGGKIMPGAARLADRAYFRTELAKAEARWTAARAFFYDAAERGWEALAADGAIPLATENLMRLSATHAAHDCAAVVQSCYRIVGMAAVHKAHVMQHIMRDAMVVTQHASLSEATYESAGAVLAGMSPGSAYP